MFACLILTFLTLEAFSNAQFFDPQLPLQFAGFAAINIPSTENEELSETGNNYYPYTPFQHFAVRNQVEQLQQFQQLQQLQQHQQQVPILPQQPQLISNAISSLPKQGVTNERNLWLPAIPQLSRGSSTLEHATYLSLINDKENFQASGCGWDLIRLQCHDLFGLCKGGCRDFAIALNSPVHDCRCVPYGYLALVKLAGK